MNEDEQLSPLGAEMVAGLSAFCDAVESGEPIGKRFTVRTVQLDLQPKPYAAGDVKHVRKTLNASQALLAKFLGVSVNAVRSWEQGVRPVPTIACRFLDEIVANPEVWKQRLRQAVSTKQSESIGP
jgi:DNA-binding transcriptional regulator YiaG